MFRLQNQATGQEQEFLNREALLIGLEGEENRCLQLNIDATFTVFNCDKQGSVLESMKLTIPSSSEQDIEELLGDFGLKKEEKGAFWHRSKNRQQTQTKIVTGVKSKENLHTNSLIKLLKILFLLIPTILSLFSLYWLSRIQQQKNNQPKQIKTEQIVLHQEEDVFCRFFISNFYQSNDSSLDFLSKNIDKDNLDIDKATPVSVLLEKQEQKGKNIDLTYVINLRYDDKTVTSKRLTLTVKKDQKAKYGFLVVKTPKQAEYP